MLSIAEAKFLGNSATAIMSLQKVTPQATVILPRYRSMYRVSQKNVDLCCKWYNSFIYQGIFPKFCMVEAK